MNKIKIYDLLDNRPIVEGSIYATDIEENNMWFSYKGTLLPVGEKFRFTIEFPDSGIVYWGECLIKSSEIGYYPRSGITLVKKFKKKSEGDNRNA